VQGHLAAQVLGHTGEPCLQIQPPEEEAPEEPLDVVHPELHKKPVHWKTPFSNLQQSGGALSLKHLRVG
jgi:hypothetical protein